MLKTLIISAYVIMVLSWCAAGASVGDYVSRRMAETVFWGKHFVSKQLEEERLMISMAVAAIRGLHESLNNILQFSEQDELGHAMEKSNKPAVVRCVKAVEALLSEQKRNATLKFRDVTENALDELRNNLESWKIRNRENKMAFERIQKGFDMCADLYSTMDSLNRLKACLEFERGLYFKDTNRVLMSLQPSPVMEYFQSEVVRCASDTAREMQITRNYTIQSLFKCIGENDVNLQDFTDVLNNWKTYNLTDTLYDQVQQCRLKTTLLTARVDADLRKLNRIRNILQELQPRTVSEYEEILDDHLIYDFHVLWTAYTRYPNDKECLPIARERMDSIVNKAVRRYQEVDERTVKDATVLVTDMEAVMESVNFLLPAFGDAAILACLTDGDIFEDNAVRDCYDQSTGNFWFAYMDVHENVLAKIAVVEHYIKRLSNNTLLKEELNILNHVTVLVDDALLALRDCLKDKQEINSVEDPKGSKSTIVSGFSINANPTSNAKRPVKQLRLIEKRTKSEGINVNNE